MSNPAGDDLDFKHVQLPETVRSRDEAIRFLVGHLSETRALPTDGQEAAIEAILRREQLGSTGIGNGIAIPHAKIHGARRVLGVLGQSPPGIEWNAVDGRPVQVVCLLLAPVDRPGDLLRALERMARRLRERPPEVS
jgi:PTS system fructose-specific IIA component/PTS system nitrogen regulatory IIA component